MYSIGSTNVVLSIADMLSLKKDNKFNSITNLCEKLCNSIHTDIVTKDALLASFVSTNTLPIYDEDLTTNITNLSNIDSLLDLIPVKIRVSHFDGYSILHTGENSYSITDAQLSSLTSNTNSYFTELTTVENNKLLGRCISGECNVLCTTMLQIKNYITVLDDAMLLGADFQSDMVYIHLEIPLEYVTTFLSKIHGYNYYFTNTIADKQLYINDEFLAELFSKDIVSIKNNRVRALVFKLRKIWDMTVGNDGNLHNFIPIVIREIKAPSNNVSINDLHSEFPEWEYLGEEGVTDIVMLTIAGLTPNITISNAGVNATSSRVLSDVQNQLTNL